MDTPPDQLRAFYRTEKSKVTHYLGLAVGLVLLLSLTVVL